MPDNQQTSNGGAAAAALERGEELGQQMKAQAEDVLSKAGKTADEMASSAGRRLEAMAEGIRQHTPSQGVLSNASRQLASTLDSSGRYLEEHGVTGLADEVTEIIRRNPIPAIFVAL